MTIGTATVRHYLAAMEEGDLHATFARFTSDAIVVSPVYGSVAVRHFYEHLFADTIKVKLDFYAVYEAVGDHNRMIAHFGYKWQRLDRPCIDTNIVYFVEIDHKIQRIKCLPILFDSALRA